MQVPTTRYPELEEMQAELDNVALLYNLYQEVEAAMTQWHNTLWHEMNLPAVADVVQGFQVIPAVSSMPESPMLVTQGGLLTVVQLGFVRLKWCGSNFLLIASEIK